MPWLRFFPSATAVAEGQMPSRDEVVRDFTGGGFALVSAEGLMQEMAPSLGAFAERASYRAISTLDLIPDDEFERGLEEMRAAARKADPGPIRERVDLIVFRR